MRRLILFLLFFVMIGAVHAQFTYGTTGLLNMPTADMQRDKTFMFGGGFLGKHATPARWTYNTFNYYFDITIFLITFQFRKSSLLIKTLLSYF